MSENVIEARDLTKRYNGTAVVNGISFSVARGEIFGLLGPNGAGKTTTIMMLLGLSDISSGQARVLGYDPAREPLAVKRRVGYLADQVGFYDNLTAARELRRCAADGGSSAASASTRSWLRSGVGLACDRQTWPDFRAACASGSGWRNPIKGSAVAISRRTDSGRDPQATVELLIIRELAPGRERSAVVASARAGAKRCDRVACSIRATCPHGNRARLAVGAGGAFASRWKPKGRGSPSDCGVRAAARRRANRVPFADRDVWPGAAAAVVAPAGAAAPVGRGRSRSVYTRYFQTHAGERQRKKAQPCTASGS
jgi:ABC-2 type transport system ATP-binding protein